MKHTCPNCKVEFSGRSNKKFCSLSCKNEAYYAKEQDLRKRNRNVSEIMKRNERILRAKFQNQAEVRDVSVYKSDLAAFGFSVNGPFWVENQKYYVGNFVLTDKGLYFEISLLRSGLAIALNKFN